MESLFQKKFFTTIDFGLRYTLIYQDIYKYEPGKQITQKQIAGTKNGYVSGAGFIFTSDSRDNRYFPGQDRYFEISYMYFGKELGSNYTFNQITVNWRKYFTPVLDHILAFQTIMDFQSGSPPFQLMTKLGGSHILRGHYEGRYRDRKMIALQTEYRTPVFSRIRFVAFAGIGDVAHDIKEFESATLKYSSGLGIRYKLNDKEKLNIRFDFGISDSGTGLYLTMKEAL